MTFDDKLKKDLKEKLSAYFQTFLEKDKFIDENLFHLMVEVTTKTNFEVAVIITRKGQVADIMVGTQNRVNIPHDLEEKKGFNGVRVIHTHPNGNSELSELDKSALLNNKFDCVCAIGVLNGQPTTATVGFCSPSGERKVETVFVPNANYLNKYGLIEKLEQLERDYLKNQSKLHTNDVSLNRAVLVMAEIEKNDNLERDLEELHGLAQTAGVEVVGMVTQKRGKPDGRYLIGEGKLKELKDAVQNTHANLVVFDNELSGSKQSNLAQALGVDVIDRSMLILDIFALRAKTSEGKLQVELAQLKYLLPRVGSMMRGHQGSSGIGLRGPGESKIELSRRIIENNILKKEKELEQAVKNRQITRSGRRRSNKPVVSIVGYTNSGKSTLMNTLSGAGVYEKDELFATLDTTTRNVWLSDQHEILLIDTVGFINKLPHEFINAFRSTLEETVFADLLVHVVDASDKNYETHLQVVLEVLDKLQAKAPIITVFNKIDKVTDLTELKEKAPLNSVFISAKKGTNINNLKQEIVKQLKKLNNAMK